mmetsp:Transcript_11006/g.44334  ORF Transcript_11006/g.44334 Transcript_11006/m.44334 type:complete len:436 (-) Transcript_11006:32-1339(-)
MVLLPGHGHDVRLAGRRRHRHRHRHRRLVLHAIPRLVSLQVLRREKHAELLRVTQHRVRREPAQVRVQLLHATRDKVLVAAGRQGLVRPGRDEVPAVRVREPVGEAHEIAEPPPRDVLRQDVLGKIAPRRHAVEHNLLAKRARRVGARLRIRHERLQHAPHGALVDARRVPTRIGGRGIGRTRGRGSRSRGGADSGGLARRGGGAGIARGRGDINGPCARGERRDVAGGVRDAPVRRPAHAVRRHGRDPPSFVVGRPRMHLGRRARPVPHGIGVHDRVRVGRGRREEVAVADTHRGRAVRRDGRRGGTRRGRGGRRGRGSRRGGGFRSRRIGSRGGAQGAEVHRGSRRRRSAEGIVRDGDVLHGPREVVRDRRRGGQGMVRELSVVVVTLVGERVLAVRVHEPRATERPVVVPGTSAERIVAVHVSRVRCALPAL